ncbi:F0F1 ATP synthase subunit gamma [Bacteroides sp. 519]|uniref:F0F1 ATP synthase subunit gamma n=1 Tax=Bacteroides sp. 519 TaxID=2302937 RepID=UPI0013D76066|nr:F0F1 ATP synthase subunit gamma [Bacteroides sp. 519]NDV60146.1 F0F1 ATP synthase subunit gamma [Bacteroides sp. 519]
MASLKEIKTRINSVKSTRKITSAMRMVASAKLHRAQRAIENMLPYQQKMDTILTRFLSSYNSVVQSVYVSERPVQRVAIVAFSSNTSLAGGFNANVVKSLLQTVEEYKPLGKENILIYPVGKKIEEEVKKQGFQPQGSYQEMADKPSYTAAANLAKELMSLFSSGKVDKVEFIVYHFKSVGSQTLAKHQYLPILLNKPDKQIKKQTTINYVVEPSIPAFITDLLPQVLELNLYTALLDSNASEHAARAMAMQTATDNANELIDELARQYNKSRQQAITNELLDIVGGSMR